MGVILVYAFLLYSSIASAVKGDVWGVVWTILLVIVGGSFLAHVFYEMKKDKKRPELVNYLWETEKARIDKLAEKAVQRYLTKGDKASNVVYERDRVIYQLLQHEVLIPVHADGVVGLAGYKNNYSYIGNLVGYRVSRHIAGEDKSPTPNTHGKEIYFTKDFEGPMNYFSLIKEYEKNKKAELITSGWAKPKY